MEEVIQFIIAIIFIGVALAFKLMEMAGRKKMPLPLPELPLEEELPEEFEVQPQLEPKKKIVPPSKKTEIIREAPIPEALPLGLSIDDLKKGIILSVILGPPKALFRRRQV